MLMKNNKQSNDKNKMKMNTLTAFFSPIFLVITIIYNNENNENDNYNENDNDNDIYGQKS